MKFAMCNRIQDESMFFDDALHFEVPEDAPPEPTANGARRASCYSVGPGGRRGSCAAMESRRSSMAALETSDPESGAIRRAKFLFPHQKQTSVDSAHSGSDNGSKKGEEDKTQCSQRN